MSAEPVSLLGVEELLALPDPRWLIDGLVPDESLSGLFGATGTAKSFLALDWTLSVASGVAWLGHEVERRWVVYVAAEGRAGLTSRVAAWSLAHEHPDLSRARFLPEAVNLLDGRQVGRVREAFASLPESPGLLVIDTMARTMVGGDENAARDVGLFVDAVDRLRNGGAAIVVHHTGHDGEHERGSSALRAAVDLMAKVEREGRTPRLTLSCVKSKDSAEWKPIDLRLEPVGDSCVLSRAIEPEIAAERDAELEAQVFDFVCANEPASKRRVRAAFQIRASRVDDALYALKGRGLVGSSSKGWQRVPDAPDSLGLTYSEASGDGESESVAHPFRGATRDSPRALSESEDADAVEPSANGAESFLIAAISADAASGDELPDGWTLDDLEALATSEADES